MDARSHPLPGSSAASYLQEFLSTQGQSSGIDFLTDTVIEANAVIERTIIDKRVHVGEHTRVGGIIEAEEPVLTMIGKNSEVPKGFTIEPGAVIGTDVVESDYPANVVRGDDYILTKRLAHEI